MTAGPHADPVEEGQRVVGLAQAAGTAVRLLGGVAIQLRAGDRLHAALRRTPVDIDLVGEAACGPSLTDALTAEGYRADEAFNQLEGYRRLLFFDDAHSRQLDVFVKDFAMCHTIPFGERLTLEPATLPLAELVLTKLQIVELNPKDRTDLYALLQTHTVGDGDGATVNARRIAELCARDWGLYRTSTLNLERLRAGLGDVDVGEPARARIAEGIGALERAIDAAPKSRGWRLRARVGDRMRWYEEPEEVGAVR